MKRILTLTFLIFLQFNSYSQNTFTSRKGLKFIPGHLDIVITTDSKNLRYELFNHWYSLSYVELRQITIPLDSLDEFNQKNDSIKIAFQKGKIKLVDKKYRFSKQIRHKSLCASASTMRKIAFAYQLSLQNNIGHRSLYDYEDLKLEEEDFNKKIMDKLKEKTISIKNN